LHDYKTEEQIAETSQVDGTTFLIKDLLPATHYEFWVSALTACGKSSISNSTKAETPIISM
jgi:hypothetical protein